MLWNSGVDTGVALQPWEVLEPCKTRSQKSAIGGTALRIGFDERAMRTSISNSQLQCAYAECGETNCLDAVR